MSEFVGSYSLGETVRVPLEVTLNGVPIAVTSPRIQRVILPNGTDASGFPVTMTTIKAGTYMFESSSFTALGSYTAIIQAEYNGNTIEALSYFKISLPFGAPRIGIACD